MTKSRQNFTGFAPADQPNPRALPVNTVLAGKYLVGKVLGQGGFGITYIGYDLNMQTKIAVKEYFPVELVHRNTTIAASDRAISLDVQSLGGEKTRIYQQGLEKYIAEARQVSKFADVPGVVSVKDFFYENHTAYIVMEYIDGVSLKDYLKQKGGKLSEEETLFILKPVLKALESVHRAGIVHRDISPDNIMLTFEQEKIASVKLIDFGAARMTSTNDQKSLTIILKHGYAPEEQYRTHGDQGPWTDVYAICATMYRMLTGKTPESSMDRILTDQLLSIKEQGVTVSKNVEAAILAGLGVKKQDRIASIEELRSYLYEGKKVPARYAQASKKQYKGSSFAQIKFRRNAAIGAVTAAVLLLAAGGFWIFTSGQNAPGTGQQAADAGQRSTDAGQQSAAQGAAGTETLPENQPSEAEGQNTGASGEVLQLEQSSAKKEIVAYPAPQTSISQGNSNAAVLIRHPDGSVRAFGRNDYGQCNVDRWSEVAAVSSASDHSLGLRSDGTVYAAGRNDEGACDVGAWTDIVAIASCWGNSFGLKKDGTVAAAGLLASQCGAEIAALQDVAAIAAMESADFGRLVALKKDGQVEYIGFSEKEELPQISGWKDVEFLSVNTFGNSAGKLSVNVVGLCSDGSVKAAGNAETMAVDGWQDIIQLSHAFTGYAGVKTDGSLVFSDEFWALNHPRTAEELQSWPPLEAVCFGESAGFALTKEGEIVEFLENSGNAELADFQNLAWADIDCTLDMPLLTAGTKDGRLLIYSNYWMMRDITERMKASGIDPASVSGKAGTFAFLQKDHSVFGFHRDGDLIWKQSDVLQCVPVNKGNYQYAFYAMLTPEGRMRFIEEGKYDDGRAFEYEEYRNKLTTAQEEWTDLVWLCSDSRVLYGVQEDGTVLSTEEWKLDTPADTIRLYASDQSLILALTKGKKLHFARCDEEARNTGILAAQDWENVEEAALGYSHVAALLSDGTVVAAGSNYAGQCEVSDWKDIVFLTAGKNATLGITADGELKIAGSLY